MEHAGAGMPVCTPQAEAAGMGAAAADGTPVAATDVVSQYRRMSLKEGAEAENGEQAPGCASASDEMSRASKAVSDTNVGDSITSLMGSTPMAGTEAANGVEQGMHNQAPPAPQRLAFARLACTLREMHCLLNLFLLR